MFNASSCWPLGNTSTQGGFTSKDSGCCISHSPYITYRQMSRANVHTYIPTGNSNWKCAAESYCTGSKCAPSPSTPPRILGGRQSQGNKYRSRQCSCVWAPAVKTLLIRDAPAHGNFDSVTQDAVHITAGSHEFWKLQRAFRMGRNSFKSLHPLTNEDSNLHILVFIFTPLSIIF